MNLDLVGWFLVFVRAGALLTLFPFFSGQSFPIQVRVGLAALIAFLVTPVLPPVELGDPSILKVARLMFSEASVGLLLGFICRLIFYALDVAGALVATETGLMLSTSFNPLASSMATAPGMMLYWLGLMLLLSLDLHHWMLVGFQRSYSSVGIGQAHLGPALFSDIVARTSGIFVVGLQVAAPVIAVSLIITLVFSVLARAVPQMNVFAESFPVRSMAGLVVFGLACPLVAQHILNYLHRLPQDFLRVSQLMGMG